MGLSADFSGSVLQQSGKALINRLKKSLTESECESCSLRVSMFFLVFLIVYLIILFLFFSIFCSHCWFPCHQLTFSISNLSLHPFVLNLFLFNQLSSLFYSPISLTSPLYVYILISTMNTSLAPSLTNGITLNIFN